LFEVETGNDTPPMTKKDVDKIKEGLKSGNARRTGHKPGSRNKWTKSRT
jgi:hypothetical protein